MLNEEFRYTVAGLIGLDEVLKRFDKYDDLFARVLKGMEGHSEEIIKLGEDMKRGFDLVNRQLSALGARWGLMAENAFGRV